MTNFFFFKQFNFTYRKPTEKKAKKDSDQHKPNKEEKHDVVKKMAYDVEKEDFQKKR